MRGCFIDLASVLLSVLICLLLSASPALALASAPTIGSGGWGIEFDAGYSSALDKIGYEASCQIYYGLGEQVDISLLLGYRKLYTQNDLVYGAEAKLLLLREGVDSPALAVKVSYQGYRHMSGSGSMIPVTLVVSKIYGPIEPFAEINYNLSGGYFGAGAGLEYPLNISSSLTIQAGYDAVPNQGVFSADAGYEFVF